MTMLLDLFQSVGKGSKVGRFDGSFPAGLMACCVCLVDGKEGVDHDHLINTYIHAP